MPDRPITIIAPAIGALMAGSLSRLRRPRGGGLDECQPGDRLWVREQFYMPRQFDHRAPSRAAADGAVPVYAHDRADLPDWACADLGRKHFARSMPKVWHRQHLVVTSTAIEPLHAITDDEVANEGHASRESYAAAWNASVSLSGWSQHWRNDPQVLVIDFRWISAPLPVAARSGAA